jgi:hypothetical protein
VRESSDFFPDYCNYLNPVPLQAVYERWIRKFEQKEVGCGFASQINSRKRQGCGLPGDVQVRASSSNVCVEGIKELPSARAGHRGKGCGHVLALITIISTTPEKLWAALTNEPVEKARYSPYLRLPLQILG